MNPFDEYIKKQQDKTDKALKEQGEVSAQADANAAASALAGGIKAGGSIATGGTANPDIQVEAQPVQNAQLEQADINPYDNKTQEPTEQQPKVITNPVDNKPYVVLSDGTLSPAEKVHEDNAEQTAEATLDSMLKEEGDVVTGPDGKQYKKLPDGTLAPMTPVQEESGENTYSTQPAALEEEQPKQSFDEQIATYFNRMKQQEQEMKDRERANMLSSMATGTTELAAGIVNMLSVGGLHASNQRYNDYTQDWMRKSDEDLREHRRRRENMRDTYDRLVKYQNDIKKAESLEQMRAQQKAEAEAKAEAKAKKDRDAAMMRQGFVPDESAEGGYRFDQELFDKMHPVKQKSSTVTYKSDRATKTPKTPVEKKDSASGVSISDELRSGSSAQSNTANEGSQKVTFVPSYLDRWSAERAK